MTNWSPVHFFRIKNRKEVLCLDEDKVQKACVEWNVARTDFDVVCAELGIEIGKPDAAR